MSEQVQPWEQLPDEPIVWHDLFMRYYLPQGSTRSVHQAYLSYYKDTKEDEELPNVASGKWYEKSREWQWEKRAQAYDRWDLDKFYANFEELREKSKKRRIASLELMQNKLDAAIRLKTTESASKESLAQLSQAQKNTLRETREERDGAATHNVIDVNVVIEKLSPELQAVLSAAIKLAST